MATHGDPETEVFEITDFTTASEWERFISKVEEVLGDWKLTGNCSPVQPVEKGEYTSSSWGEESQEVLFADFKFHLTHYFLKQAPEEEEDGAGQLEEDVLPVALQDLLCMKNDFPPRAHCLVRWFGLRQFLVISPGTNCEAVVSESKCNLLLSSASVALGNSGCQVPMFVQIQQKWRRLYVGEFQGPGVRTHFEMVQVRKVPRQYQNLSGLLDIFKSKIGCSVFPLPPVTISIRFTFVLQDWQQSSWPQQPPDFDTLLGGEVGGVEFGKLPFGACEEPISELHLSTTWHHLTEGMVVDNDVYSDLDPLQAPHWSVRVRTADNPQCLLGDFLTEFFKLCCRKESSEELLGRSTEDEGKDNSDISSALSKLTEPAASVPISRLSVSTMMHTAKKHIQRHRRPDECPLNTDVLNSVLLFLFPDAAVEKNSDSMKSSTSPPPTESQKNSDSTKSGTSPPLTESNLFLQLKSAPCDSLTSRLALCVCLVNYNYGGLRSVAHLWQEVVLELRYRWENNYLVYGLPGGAPDLRCCLLHQKFQMLNCCIERKRARDEGRRVQEGDKDVKSSPHGAGADTARGAPPGKSWDSWSDSEEEFFECLSDQGESDFAHGDGERRAEGRLHALNGMTLLNSTEPLYVPVTQEPAPMTEDLLEEQSEVLAKLGSSAEGTHLRARMQSACLLSDMESFKAANPGCVLEDFVRWYSPRDYVEETGDGSVQGQLSARMRIPGNMWVEAWETARVTPARRQRRLFDDTTEAEKVLHYLAMLKPADVARHLLPCMLHAAILKLKEEESAEDVPSVRKMIQHTTSQASKLLQSSNLDLSKLEESITQLMTMETVITRARSLKAKFSVAEDQKAVDTDEMEKFVGSLLEEPEVVVGGAGKGVAGGIIHRLFINAQRAALLSPADEDVDIEKKQAKGRHKVPDFPPPTGREILLRTCVPRPAPYSKALPQRLFCVLMKDEFRLAGAFSSDISFF